MFTFFILRVNGFNILISNEWLYTSVVIRSVVIRSVVIRSVVIRSVVIRSVVIRSAVTNPDHSW